MAITTPASSKMATGTSGLITPYVFQPRVMQMFFDVVASMSSFLAYQYLRTSLLPDVRAWTLAEYTSVAGISACYWLVVFWVAGLYRDWYVRSPFDEIFTVLRHTSLGALTLFFAIFISSPDSFRNNPRFIFLMYFAILFMTVAIGRQCARKLQRMLRNKGVVQIPAMLLGTPDDMVAMKRALAIQRSWGYRIVGAVTLGAPQVQNLDGIPVLGGVDELEDVLARVRPHEVIISTRTADHQVLLECMATCTDADVAVKIEPNLYEVFSGQTRTLQIYGSPLIDVSPELMKPWEEFAKRTLDIVISAMVLIVGLPVWLLVGIVVKVSSPGAALYSQKRVGRNGHDFMMYKFRSMYTDDRRKPSWTEKNDPRVTPFGRFIRKTHLDEVPQLWNVLSGEMSLVGPRPELPFFVEKFNKLVPHYRRRHKIRPGVTGWWQVKAKSNPESVEEIEQRIRYDFYYIEHMSFKLDLEILVRTFFVMIKGHGKA